MDTQKLEEIAPGAWRIPREGAMRVPGIVYGTRELVEAMDDKVHEQMCNVAALPGIVRASYAMPDAHWGYGFPIGGVAAFDANEGVVSAGGVGFDISCGVRCLITGLESAEIRKRAAALAELLFATIPAGVGSRGQLRLSDREMDDMLRGGARWAIEHGYGDARDLERIEERGCMSGAGPECVSEHAKARQREEVGTLGSGNHYLEVQNVAEVFDEHLASSFGLRAKEAVVSIHCGSRGLGHQIGTDYLRQMVVAAREHGIDLPDRELACAPIKSAIAQDYLRAMRAAINCALANRQIITHLVRQAFDEVFPKTELPLLYDVSHNTCKVEDHHLNGRPCKLFVHRKGATRAFGPDHPAIPGALRGVGQPVLIGGTMGTASYILCGTEEGMRLAFGSACHGAGRAMSRHQALRQWRGSEIVQRLADQGVLIRSRSMRGVAEEAPGAYKDVSAVVAAADRAGLARTVARLEPIICVKG